jgi:crotonobetainyl-CoA:carnitine CoA-transferase CaiB-like acyl-CoA transferase
VLANAYVTEVEYPKYGKKLRVHGSPWYFSETPVRIGIAPELGEHNVPILRHLGYTDAQIQELKEQNVI